MPGTSKRPGLWGRGSAAWHGEQPWLSPGHVAVRVWRGGSGSPGTSAVAVESRDPGCPGLALTLARLRPRADLPPPALPPRRALAQCLCPHTIACAGIGGQSWLGSLEGPSSITHKTLPADGHRCPQRRSDPPEREAGWPWCCVASVTVSPELLPAGQGLSATTCRHRSHSSTHCPRGAHSLWEQGGHADRAPRP